MLFVVNLGELGGAIIGLTIFLIIASLFNAGYEFLMMCWTDLVEHQAYGLMVAFVLLLWAFVHFARRREKRGRRLLATFMLIVLLLGSYPFFRSAVAMSRSEDTAIASNLLRTAPWIYASPGLGSVMRSLYFPILADIALRKTGLLPDWYGYAWQCGNGECDDLAALEKRYHLNLRAQLEKEYPMIRAYALAVMDNNTGKEARLVDASCPNTLAAFTHRPASPDRGQSLLDLIGSDYDPRCACLSDKREIVRTYVEIGGRDVGLLTCPALTRAEREDGPLSDFRKYDFFTPRTCSFSATCAMMATYTGYEIGLAGRALEDGARLPAGLKEQMTDRCRNNNASATANSAANATRQRYCDCYIPKILEQASFFSPAALECLRTTGDIVADVPKCLAGQAEDERARQLVMSCVWQSRRP